MTKEIAEGIAAGIQQVFPELDIYTKGVTQKLGPPCFFIKLIQTERTARVGSRAYREHSFDVHFFPEDREDNDKMMDMADCLEEILLLVKLQDGTMAHGKSLKSEIIDGVLHVYVDYNLFTVRKEEKEKMEKLEEIKFDRKDDEKC